MKKLFSLIIFLMLFSPGVAAPQDSLSYIPERQAEEVAPLTVERHFTPGYKSKYTTDEFDYERKENNKKRSKWEEFLHWLADFFSSDGRADGQGLSVGQILKRVGAVIIVLGVIYFIVRALIKKEGYWIFGKAKKNITANDIGIENIETTDFSSLINSTLQNGDFRLGIRYYYLWLLKLLAYNNAIKWHKDKTNSDYLYEIKDENLRARFKYLSYIYDYSWYGEFAVNKDDFAKAEKVFLQTINGLKR